MPDMSKPGAHIQEAHDIFKYKAMELRRKAATLTTQADIYEQASYDLRDAIDKEAAKKPSDDSTEEQSNDR